MDANIKCYDENNSLSHYGVKGMKWRKHKIKWKPEGNVKSTLRFTKDQILYNANERSYMGFKVRLAARDAIYNLGTRKNKTSLFIKSSGPLIKRGLDHIKKHHIFSKASRVAFKTYSEPLKFRKKY